MDWQRALINEATKSLFRIQPTVRKHVPETPLYVFKYIFGNIGLDYFGMPALVLDLKEVLTMHGTIYHVGTFVPILIIVGLKFLKLKRPTPSDKKTDAKPVESASQAKKVN